MKVNNRLIISLFIIFLSSNAAQQPISDYLDYKILDVNNLTLFIENDGSARQGFGGFWRLLDTYGLSAGDEIIYDQGIWVIGKVNGELKLSFSQWASTYSPGPIINGEPAKLETTKDSIKYRVYKINKYDSSHTNPDYRDWPDSLGAPNNDGIPIVYNDQTLWSVFNSLNPDSAKFSYINNYFNSPITSMPIEIQQIVHASKGITNPPLLADVAFFEYTIINKGQDAFDSCYIGFWADIDIYNLYYNYPAVDTSLQLGYLWYGREDYAGQIPPAIGFQLLYGPVVESQGNNAIFRGRELANNINLGLNSYHPNVYSSAIKGAIEVWNVARGLDRFGNARIDPSTGEVTKFQWSGDPVTNTGWNFDLGLTKGAGFVLFSGPFNLAANDTQWVMFALVPGLGSDRFNSITKMRNTASYLMDAGYNNLVKKYSASNDRPPLEIVDIYSLEQNYPNPFNSGTRFGYTLSNRAFIKIDVFNLLGEHVATLRNEEMEAGYYKESFSAGDLPSGVYIYRLLANDKLLSRKMILLR